MNNYLDKRINVFIGYNKKDRKIAEAIATFLSIGDIGVWYDEWEIRPGESIIEKVNNGLTECTHYLLLWSKNSSDSNWVKKEIDSILYKSIQCGYPIIIPIILDKKPILTILKDKKYIRYEKDIDKNRELILEAITGKKPEEKLARAILNKYKELTYDLISDDPLAFLRCPTCGSANLERSSDTDYARDDTYYSIKCKDCNWSDWTM